MIRLLQMRQFKQQVQSAGQNRGKSFNIRRVATCAFGCYLLIAVRASAQTELSGPIRDIARAAIIDPVAFDPLATLPFTSSPQAVIDAHGADVVGMFHAAVRSGDDNYGILASIPLSTTDSTTLVDPSGLRRHASFGFHLTNILWHPKAKPVLERQLGPTGFLRLTDEERTSAAQTIATMDAVDVPWVIFLTGNYRLSRTGYVYADPQTLAQRSVTHGNDTAVLLGGVQLFARRGDPGYFAAFSYTYSSIFEQSAETASNGLPANQPTRARRNLLTVEMRRPFVAAHVGLNPSFAVDKSSGVRTIAATGYWWPKGFGNPATGHLRGLYAGMRIGDESQHEGQGGFFITAFIGTVIP